MELSTIYLTIQSILQDIANAPDGITTSDIVQKYDISRGVVPKYIRILEDAGVPIYTDRKRYYVADGYHTAFTLTPEESELLALSLQRSLLQYGESWRPIRHLIQKLVSKMPAGTADGLHPHIDSDLDDLPSRQWFAVLARAKRERHQVWVEYHPLNRAEPTRWKIKPYRFFANPFSDGLYVLCDGTQNERDYVPLSLKFDRILNVSPTPEKFAIADLAHFASSERQAWGVWSTSDTPTRVVLHFEPRHYDRLIESVWHPTQRISFDNDGIVRFVVEVSNPQEMIPWIRSWGSGVTVEEPRDLRLRIIRSLQRQMQAYGLTAHQADAVTSKDFLWAKYNRQDHSYHPLLYHLLDVAAVALAMWENILTYQQRVWVAELLQTDESTAKQTMAFLAGIHDIGKATPGFQKKAPPIYKQLLATGITNSRILQDVPHGILSTCILERIFKEEGIEHAATSALASVIGGHHGAWISALSRNNARSSTGDAAWHILQNELFQQLKAATGLDHLQLTFMNDTLNRFSAFLSGFISLCDWIGSNEDYFPYKNEMTSAESYWQQAREQALIALDSLGWHRWPEVRTLARFGEMFDFDPNPFQNSAMGYLDALTAMPRLILIEYLTGGGKTELALYVADQLINKFGLNGAYIAMPTQATSNQMFERVSAYLQARYPQHLVHLQLAHAQAEHHALYQQFQSRPQREGNESGIVAEQWFQNRKRTLLAPYVVGTVDQAMLSVLQVQHHFVRLYALSQRVILFDEIHSYDVYMNTIIERLMEWLTSLQSPQILLSATLSAQNRQSLLSHVGANTQNIPDVPYPRMTVVLHDGQVEVHPLPRPATHILQIQHISDDIGLLCATLAEVYQLGGCIAVICNTVDEAIKVTQALHHHPTIDPEDVWLFHARFPFAWRNEIEQQVLADFGKHGARPERKILVATQVIEQSLDLDFDLIVSSIAPIDLLIQRAGRLHRHERTRPAHLEIPFMLLRAPQSDEEGIPNFGVDGVVYARFILLKTWILLQGRTTIAIPDELDAMMDFVYSRDYADLVISDALHTALEDAAEELALTSNRSVFRSTTHRIAAPSDEMFIGGFTEKLPDDDDHGITTRDIRPGVDIVCVSTDDDSNLPYPLGRKPTRDEIQLLLQYRLTIQRPELVKAIKALPLNSHWEHVPTLRYARVMHFTHGEAAIPNSDYRLKLTPIYGLEMIEE